MSRHPQGARLAVSLYCICDIPASPHTSLLLPCVAYPPCCTLRCVPCHQLGLDYSALRDYLAEGDVRKADDETRALLIKMAGQGAVQRGWVYFTGATRVGLSLKLHRQSRQHMHVSLD